MIGSLARDGPSEDNSALRACLSLKKMSTVSWNVVPRTRLSLSCSLLDKRICWAAHGKCAVLQVLVTV